MPVDVLANLSDQFLIGAIAVYATALLAHAGEYAFGDRRQGVDQRRASDQLIEGKVPVSATATVGVGSAGLEAATTDDPAPVSPVSGWNPAASWPLARWFGRAAITLTAIAAMLHAASLVTRGVAAERVPWGNLYEYVSSVCLIGVLAWLVLVARQPRLRHIGVFVLLPVVLLLGLAGTVLYARVAPLVPALQSSWLKIHVLAAAISSGVFLVGFAIAGLQLLRRRYEVITDAERGLRFPVTLGARLPDAEALERLSFKLHAFAFPIWTFAVIAGAIWAEAAWGRFWGWDPKETWAFISWVVYAGYLHARATAGWQGTRAGIVAVVGGLTMIMNLFVVNLVVSGLHSYAGV